MYKLSYLLSWRHAGAVSWHDGTRWVCSLSTSYQWFRSTTPSSWWSTSATTTSPSQRLSVGSTGCSVSSGSPCSSVSSSLPEVTMTWKKYSNHHIVPNDKACQGHSQNNKAHLSSHGASGPSWICRWNAVVKTQFCTIAMCITNLYSTGTVSQQ